MTAAIITSSFLSIDMIEARNRATSGVVHLIRSLRAHLHSGSPVTFVAWALVVKGERRNTTLSPNNMSE